MGSVGRLHSQAQRGSMQACRRLLVLSALVLLVAALNANEVQDEDAVVELGDNLVGEAMEGKPAKKKPAKKKAALKAKVKVKVKKAKGKKAKGKKAKGKVKKVKPKTPKGAKKKAAKKALKVVAVVKKAQIAAVKAKVN